MADRRALIGTSAVVLGVGTALLSGTSAAVAGADTGDSSDSRTAAAQPAQKASAVPGSRRAPRPKAAASANTDRGGKTAAARATRVIPVPAPAVAVPEVSVSAAAPAASIAPVASARRSMAQAVTAVAVAAPGSRAAAATPAPTALLAAVLSGFGWHPGTGAVITSPAVATPASPRQSVTAASVVGAAVVGAAPPEPLLPVAPTNGVTGVVIGHSRLEMPGAFFGNFVAADWYFPTQSDGTIGATGVVWLQHGFGAWNSLYADLAIDIAQQTNSIVVAPTLSSLPFTFSGGCLVCGTSQQAAAQLFLDPDRAALVSSAQAAGFTGDVNELLGSFVISGHSAGGGFSSAMAADYLTDGSDLQDADLAGVVMFDGVSNGVFDGTFTNQVNILQAAGKPIYQIAAPAQSWNLYGATTNQLVTDLGDAGNAGGTFAGVVLQGGSHVDSMIGNNAIFNLVLQLVTKPVPAGNTAAVHQLSAGWINDMFAGATPDAPQFGLYAGAGQAIIMGPTAALALPSPIANQLSFVDKITKGLIDAVGGLLGFSLPAPVNTGDNGLDPNVPVAVVGNGVTGVRTGHAVLDIPCGPSGYAAPADWYFPTQADGTVTPNGIIWLQHGFLGFNSWYADTAQALAQQTNSIVVAPNIFWFNTPICPGCYLSGDAMHQAVAEMFTGPRSALNVSANAAGFEGTLPEQFILTGHSAGGNFATAVGGYTVDNGAAENLLGVVMFDGVSYPEVFATSLAKLDSLGIPDYQIAAPPQRWNAYGRTTDQIALLHPDQFVGVQINNGSHTDVIAGSSLFADLAEIASAIVVKPSPPGAHQAVNTFATGWINDIYAGNGPGTPLYGVYNSTSDGVYVPDQPIVMGRAGATTLPAPPPVDVNQYQGTWYEQGSVKLPFAWGLVNTKAVYTPQPDGSIKVENSGNYFGPNGPYTNIVGSAVSVNDPTNTRLNVGFFFGKPKSTGPGNYWILDYAPDYSWVIVGDPIGFSGYILTRDQTFRTDNPDEYAYLLKRARQLGVWGPITPTAQYP